MANLAAQYREQIIDAAVAWFRALKPVSWPEEKHLHNPRCNTTTNEAEALAVATAAYLRNKRRRKARRSDSGAKG